MDTFADVAAPKRQRRETNLEKWRKRRDKIYAAMLQEDPDRDPRQALHDAEAVTDIMYPRGRKP